MKRFKFEFVLEKVSQRTTNTRPTCSIRHAPKTFSMLCARISHVYILVSIDKLAQTLKIFLAYLFGFQDIL